MRLFVFSSFFLLLRCEAYHFDYDELSDSKEYGPEEVLAPLGGYAILNCDVDFPQQMEIPHVINWKKDGEMVYSKFDSLVMVNDPLRGRVGPLTYPILGMGRGSINITDLRESDGGSYHCITYFPNRNPSTRNNGTWVHLTVTTGNLILNPPVNRTVSEFEDVILRCDPRQLEAKIKWYKDGAPITELHEIFHRSFVSDDGSLTIRSIPLTDMGEYTCQVITLEGKKQAASAFVNVISKAKVIYTPKEVFLPYGLPGHLDCYFIANPPLTKMEWEKDGILFHPLNIPGVYSRENGSVYFTNVTEEHEGLYRCTPFNVLGTEGPSDKIHVYVLRPPTFTLRPLSLYLKKLGENVVIPCEATDGNGEHDPIITWMRKDETSLPAGRFLIKEGNLTIFNIKETDRGVYQCFAMNRAATVVIETELLVENVPPRAPYNLTAKTTNNSIVLRWIPGRKRHQIKYSILYKPIGSDDWKSQDVSSEVTETKITNITQGVEYELKVLSADPHGESILSKPIKVWTVEEGSDKQAMISSLRHRFWAPKNLRIEPSYKDTSYLLTWDPSSINQRVIMFIVKWYKGSPDNVIASTETETNIMRIGDLIEGETYHFDVTAIFDEEYEGGQVQATSEKITITVPVSGKIQALAISVTVFVIIFLMVLLSIFYGKNKFCRKNETRKEEKIPENNY